MPEWITRYWAEFLFGIVIAALTAGYRVLSKKLKKEMADNKATRVGVQALLRDRIIQSYNHYAEKEYIPIYGLENVLSMYNSYHELGGNGTVTELVETLREMPHSESESVSKQHSL